MTLPRERMFVTVSQSQQNINHHDAK